MGFPKVAIDEHVRPTLLSNARAAVANAKEQGVTDIFLQLPAEDFAAAVNETVQRVRAPFTPTLAGELVGPWEKAHPGLMGKQLEAKPTGPLLFNAQGQPIDEVT